MNPVTLTWRLLTADELTRVYLDEMRRDFPQSELKPLSMILTSEAAGTAHTWGVFDGDTLAAYLLMKRKWLAAMEKGGAEPQAVPAMAASTVTKERAAAFQELYNSMFRARP